MPGYVHTDRGTSFMSGELKNFLFQHGVSTSRTTPYNPRGNGQCERYNGVIWKTINLALQSVNLPVSEWEKMLPVALHSIRSLLCTATNETPHERFLSFTRRSVNGQSTPTWLLTPGPVLMRKHVRNSKYEPLVEEVELVSANPNYANIRKKNGVETTVSVRDLAPIGFRGESTVHDCEPTFIPPIETANDTSIASRREDTTTTTNYNAEKRTLKESDPYVSDVDDLKSKAEFSHDLNPAPAQRRPMRIRNAPDRYCP